MRKRSRPTSHERASLDEDRTPEREFVPRPSPFQAARHEKSDKRNWSRGADLGQMQEMFALPENANRKYIR